MDTRHLMNGGRGTWRLLSATIVALVLILALEASPTTAASACRVTNGDSGNSYTTLQSAVDAAHRGDRLTVRGTCHGGTVIHKNLAVEGMATGEAILDGDGETRVLMIGEGVKVTLSSLVVRDGRAHIRRWRQGNRSRCVGGLTCGRMGGGINNKGTLTLQDVVVRDSIARYVGGGINNGGDLTLRGSSRVVHNTGWYGGGVSNWSGTITLDDRSKITGNTARGAGGAYNRFGILILNDSSRISGNTSRRAGGGGVGSCGTLTLNDSSTISGNDARGTYPALGGGVFICGAGTLTLNDSSTISGNASAFGGGVYSVGTVTLNDSSSIIANTARKVGGGVYVYVTIAMFTMAGSSSINGNSAGDRGGGVYVGAGSVLNGVSCGPQTLANVFGNTPDDCFIESP